MAKKNLDEEIEEERPRWVNPNKGREDEEAPRQKWVNPNKGREDEEAPRQKWVNPKWISQRERMDSRLERAGLLNYQTQGLSQEEIARRYAAAGISINGGSSWYKENYGVDAPEVLTDRSKMFEYRKQLFEGTAPSIFPRLEPQLGTKTPAGGTADRPQNFVTGANGLLVRAPQTTPKAVTDSPYAAGVFATVDQARKGEANWTDIASTERAKLLNDPNFYKSGQITQYPVWMQQQILADPAFDWDKLPIWQKAYYELSSSPAGMGAVQGGLMGLIGGPAGGVVGAALGSGLGWAAGKSGYDPIKEFWEQDNLTAGAFGLLNWLAEQAEKTAGMGFQAAHAAADPTRDVKDILTRESWDAGASFFEVITPAYIDAVNEGKGELGWDDLLKLSPPDYVLTRIGDLILNPEKYPGEEAYLGAESPIQLDQSWVERIDQARKDIKYGRPYREVMMDMQAGVVAQIGDMAGQAIADPLNVLPDVQTRVLGKVAEAGGHKVAATALGQSSSLVEAGRKYKTLVQTGQALTIDPNFKVDQMGRFSRFVAGINEAGQVKAGSLFGTQKGLLDPIRNKTGFIEDMATQTPHSRAQQGAGMFYENISAMLQMFKTPEEAGKYLRALAKNDMKTWGELGSRFAESPEWYTVLPALKEFNTDVLDGIVQTWEMTSPNRDLLARVADVMGDQPGTLLEDLVKRGTAEQDFQRVVKKLQESQSPAAKALLADVEAGRFTAETLKQMVDVFTGEGALPWHEGQWKAMMLDKLGTHFDEWVTKRLMLDQSPEAKSAFFRTSSLMKQAQSILLLGGSPGYAITNGLSNMVHRAASGTFGFMTGRQIDAFMNRMGMTPARFDEGVGIGGVVESNLSPSPSPKGEGSRVKTSAMDEAVRGKGSLRTAKDALGKISKGMPFSKLSSWFERTERRQSYTIAMRDMWSQSWRRGVGFREMNPQLAQAFTEAGIDPRRVYAAIEGGMNQGEIEAALTGRRTEMQARELIHDAAEKTGMTASEAATMLERIGILDSLDLYLKGQTTRDGISQAFKRADDAAQAWMDMRTGEDLKAKAEAAKQRVGLEGGAAALDVAQKAHGEYTDAWLNHYFRFGEVMGDLRLLDDPAMMNKAIDQAYEVSNREFRRVNAANAANFKGIFEAWGMGGDARALRVLESMGAVDEALGGAYRQMRENWRGWREKWGGDLKNPQRWTEFEALRGNNDRLFKNAFRAKHEAEVKMGGALGEIYEGMYGPAAGEAARWWWEDVVAFNDEIVKREREFRAQNEEARKMGATKESIEAAKQKYYSEVKPAMILELERINGEGIARLERVMRKGGGQGTVDGGPVAPKGPEGGGEVSGVRDQAPGEAVISEQSAVSSEVASAAPRNDIDELNGLMAGAEQRKAKAEAESRERVAGVWDVAEGYWGKGGNYSRGILQDRFALLNALRKPEYGGIPDLFDLNDARLTPDVVRQVLESRKAIKEAAGAEAVSKIPQQPSRGRKFDTSQINQDTSILRAIALHGGIDLKLAKDLTGEAKPKSAPGVFTRKGSMKGYGIDEMARLLADDGYPIRLDDVNDPGGIQQTTDLINRARAGDKVYPMGHDFSADLNAAEAAWIEGFNLDETPEVPFDSALWQREFDTVVRAGDLGRVYEMIGDVPEEMLGGKWKVESDETWRDYLSRTADDVAARASEDVLMERVARKAAEAEETIREAEAHGEAMSARAVLMESLAEVFKLDEAQAGAYGELSDAVAGWYARMTGESVDDFYNRYFGEARKSDQSSVGSDQMARARAGGKVEGTPDGGAIIRFEDGGRNTLTPEEVTKQGGLEGVQKSVDEAQRNVAESKTSRPFYQTGNDITYTVELTGYPDGSFHIRGSDGQLYNLKGKTLKMKPDGEMPRRFKSFEDAKGALKKAGFDQTLTPAPLPGGEGRIPGTIDKGMVTFEGMKGTIHAFEAADFSTVIHESGHIYRQVLKDVAERTNNPYILRDLQTVEEWAGVKDGKWTREAEEKFARGFERYITEGSAPTPKLRAAFEAFKGWMLDIYKAITGSSIDVKLTDEVRRVFDRMLGAENMRLDLDNQLKQMNYDPKMWYVDPQGNIVRRPEFKLEIDQERAARDVAAMDLDGMLARAEALKARMAGGGVSPGPDAESIRSYREGWRSWSSYDEPPVPTSRVRELTDWTLGKMAEGRRMKEGPKALFQSEPSIPFGKYEEAGGFRASGDGLDALWREKVGPLLRAMEEGARDQVSSLTPGPSPEGRGVMGGAARDLSPEGQAMLKQYMRQVQNEMATTKLAAMRYAEKQTDFALLNYNRRYGFDRMTDFVMPYQFYTSRSLVNWAARSLDVPAMYSNYARLRMQQDRYERDVPERLRGKVRIPAPWLPDWAGDSLYINPMQNLFFPDVVTRFLERGQRDKNYQLIEAERVLQEWMKDEQYSEAEIRAAAQTQEGKVWERAWEEAQLRRESEQANPVDFFTSFFGPAWYLSTPLNLAGIKVPGISKGDPNKVNTTPLGNTSRALDTVTEGTWAEPFGDLIGLIGKGEDWMREKFELPTRGEYAEYYTKRQIANMVAEGRITAEQAQVAMIEQTGALWDEAAQRVDLELALRVPLAGVTYAALHEGPVAGAQAALPSLFGAGLLPSGELEFRGLKQEWNEAWKLADAGDTKAVQRFFENYPEYEAYLAKGKDDGELLKSFLIGQIWDAYMELGDTNKKLARAEMGEIFQQSFLDKETRSYETLDVNQLAAWARMLGGMVPVPKTPAGMPSPLTPLPAGEGKMKLYPEQVTAVTDQFFEQRRELYPNYYEEQSGYYALPKSERKKYLMEHPDLKAYWQWKDRWYKSYPEYVPIFKGDAFDRVDTSGWMPGLEEAVREAAFLGGQLPSGARAALMNEWMLAGMPMEDFDTWVKSVVLPGMLYGN